MLTVLQGSDLHFGKPHLPRVASAFGELVGEVDPGVIVLAGDFTQRAKVREYRQAREYIDALPDVPVIVTPGNHDIPLYRAHERLFAPFRNYRAHIESELDGFARVEGAVFVSLCSAEPHRALVNGRLGDEQLEFAARILHESSPKDVRILVTHHPLVRPPDGGADHIVPGSNALLESFREMGVELILSGHLHRSYVVQSCGGEITHVHSGTAMSNRGRMAEKERNSVNVLAIGAHEVVVTPHWFEEDENRFVPRDPTSLGRRQ